MSRLDDLYKSAMSAANRGRNPRVRQVAVRRTYGEMKAEGGYVWQCMGPTKGGCQKGVITGDPSRVEPTRRGRPPGSKNKPKQQVVVEGGFNEPWANEPAPKRRGRPPGSKNKLKKMPWSEWAPAPRRGRPPGSKNKPKSQPVDTRDRQFVKGSKEAKEWGARMAALRAAKRGG